jgi:hypothetical protein
MLYTPKQLETLKTAFNITAASIAIIGIFGAEDKSLKGYVHAILSELYKEPIDHDYLELIMREYKDYMEKYIEDLTKPKEKR